ncbi:MAG: hypothetical protein OXT74_16575, partial [Candidatus Poribacteria bacterium]|nr:hypothetical protein [Candidatus Poribacteria bacterium]
MNLLNAAKSLLLVSFLVWVASIGCSDSDAPGELPIILQLVKDDENDEGDEDDEDDENDEG